LSGRKLLSLCFFILGLAPAWSQTVTPTGTASGKLCVARVANSSGKPVNVENIEQELVQQLVNRKINAVAAPTMTVLASHLALTPSNREAFPALKCDYMLLTEIASPAVNDRSSLALRFSIFTRTRQLLPEAIIPAAAEDPSQAAMAAVPVLSDRVASVLTRKKR
jgi:hypothetical protein